MNNTKTGHWVKSLDDDMVFEGNGSGIISVKIGSFQRYADKDDIKEFRDLLDEILNIEP